MSTFKDLIRQVKSEIREISVEDARKLGKGGAVLVDVREADEFSQGHVPGAVFIPRGQLETTIEARIPRDQHVVIYCASGNRSALAAVTLAEMGYASCASMAGGFKGWAQAGHPVEG